MLAEFLIFATAVAGWADETLPVRSFDGGGWSIHRDKDRCHAEFTSTDEGQIRVRIEQAAGQNASLVLDVRELRQRGKTAKPASIAFHYYPALYEIKGTQPSLLVKSASWIHGSGRSQTRLDAPRVDFSRISSDIRITGERGRLLLTTNIKFIRDATNWVGYCAGWVARYDSGSGKAVFTQPRLKPQGAARPPDYPGQALREDRKGASIVNATVSANGRVSACDITHSSGHLDLDLAACRSIARLEFEPGKDADGLPTLSHVSRRFVWAIP